MTHKRFSDVQRSVPVLSLLSIGTNINIPVSGRLGIPGNYLQPGNFTLHALLLPQQHIATHTLQLRSRYVPLSSLLQGRFPVTPGMLT